MIADGPGPSKDRGHSVEMDKKMGYFTVRERKRLPL